MKVKLLKDHKHAGVAYSLGEVIEVDEDTAEWLANLKVATPAGMPMSSGKRGHPSPNQAVAAPVKSPSVDSVGVSESGDTPTED